MHSLSQNLKYLLQKANLSESELGRRTGIPQQVINRILSGKNVNPKITTLTALANYFALSISRLLGESIEEQGWKTIPFLDWELIGNYPLEYLLIQSKKTVMTDNPSITSFATQMIDDSMEPKFSEKTILIFNGQQTVKDKEFALIRLAEKELIFRQIFIKKSGSYIKSLNPRSSHYKLTLLNPNALCIGLLIQSRTDHIS